MILLEYSYQFTDKHSNQIRTDEFSEKIKSILEFNDLFKIKKGKIYFSLPLKESDKRNLILSFYIDKIYNKINKKIFFILRITIEKEDFEYLIEDYEKIYNVKKILTLRNLLYKKFPDKYENFKFEILKDEIAKSQLIDSYPIFFEIENSLRELITKTLNFKAQEDWFRKEIPDQIKQIIKDDRKNLGIVAFDFSHLSSIFFERSGESNFIKIISIIKNAEDCNDIDINKLKKIIPKTNWEKYFNKIELSDSSKILSDENIKNILDKLRDMRNKVAHNNLYIEDNFYSTLEELSQKILNWINEALNFIEKESYKFSQEVIKNNLDLNHDEVVKKIEDLLQTLKIKFETENINEALNLLEEYIDEDSYDEVIEEIKFFIDLKSKILKELKRLSEEDVEREKRAINKLKKYIRNIEFKSNNDNLKQEILNEE